MIAQQVKYQRLPLLHGANHDGRDRPEPNQLWRDRGEPIIPARVLTIYEESSDEEPKGAMAATRGVGKAQASSSKVPDALQHSHAIQHIDAATHYVGAVLVR